MRGRGCRGVVAVMGCGGGIVAVSVSRRGDSDRVVRLCVLDSQGLACSFGLDTKLRLSRQQTLTALQSWLRRWVLRWDISIDCLRVFLMNIQDKALPQFISPKQRYDFVSRAKIADPLNQTTIANRDASPSKATGLLLQLDC